jgi:hypothetical protein
MKEIIDFNKGNIDDLIRGMGTQERLLALIYDRAEVLEYMLPIMKQTLDEVRTAQMKHKESGIGQP